MTMDAFDNRLYSDKLVENWNTTIYPMDRKEKVIRDSACEHCEHDKNNIYAIAKELDSFGTVGEYAMCKACFDKEKEREANETTTCHDCGQKVKKSETTPWKWYDFYAAQGDEPLTICKDCWNAPKHKQRMARDRWERKQEEESYQDRDW